MTGGGTDALAAAGDKPTVPGSQTGRTAYATR